MTVFRFLKIRHRAAQVSFALCTAADNTDIRLLNGTAIDANTATGYGGGIYANAIAKELNVTVTNTALSAAILLPAVAGIFTYKSGSAVINVDLSVRCCDAR